MPKKTKGSPVHSSSGQGISKHRQSGTAPNSNHFTGKKGSAAKRRSKNRKNKITKVHYNKYPKKKLSRPRS